MVHTWICAAWMKKESNKRTAQYQNKAARRTVIQILRFWRDVVDEGTFLAHHHTRFVTRSSRRQSRSYFLMWSRIKDRLKFLRLSVFRLQVRSRRLRLTIIFSGWTLLRSRVQFQRRAVVRMQRAARRDLIHLIFGRWSSLPSLYSRALARKVIKRRFQTFFLQWTRLAFFFQNRQLCLARLQIKTARHNLYRLLHSWLEALRDVKTRAQRYSLIQLRLRHRGQTYV